MLRLFSLGIEYKRLIFLFLLMFIGVSKVKIGGLLGMVEYIINDWNKLFELWFEFKNIRFLFVR